MNYLTTMKPAVFRGLWAGVLALMMAILTLGSCGGNPSGSVINLDPELIGTWDGNGQTIVVDNNFNWTMIQPEPAIFDDTTTPDQITTMAGGIFYAQGGATDDAAINDGEVYQNLGPTRQLRFQTPKDTVIVRDLYSGTTWSDRVLSAAQNQGSLSLVSLQYGASDGTLTTFDTFGTNPAFKVTYGLTPGIPSILDFMGAPFTGSVDNATTIAAGSPWTVGSPAGGLVITLTENGGLIDMEMLYYVSSVEAYGNLTTFSLSDAPPVATLGLHVIGRNYSITGSGSGAQWTFWNTTTHGNFFNIMGSVPWTITLMTGVTLGQNIDGVLTNGTWDNGVTNSLTFNLDGTFSGILSSKAVTGHWAQNGGRYYYDFDKTLIKR